MSSPTSRVLANRIRLFVTKSGDLFVRTSYLAVLINIMVFPLVANSQEAGDPREGLQFARANCTACHAVNSSDEKSPNPNAPAFASVAKTPGMTGRALAVWLQSSHPTMPDFIIAAKDRDNVIAYIMSLQPIPEQ